MATYTTNYNLGKPEATDPFENFRQLFNDNMDEIDANLGGGGGGGHTIVDENGSDMPAESKLQFTGNVSVTDDNVNGATVVDVLGGGGNVYGAFLDPSRVVYSAFTFDSSTHSWTATEDCILTDNMTPPDSSTAYFIRIDGKQVFAGCSTVEDPFVYVKKGQVVEYRAKSGSTMKAYGIKQGTNGIFAPVIYSDNERVIGVWRDNKPLYQKTVNFGSLPANNSSKTVAHGISDIETLANAVFVVQSSTQFRTLPNVSRGNTANQTVWYMTATDIGVLTGSSADVGSAYSGYVTLQYTKSTDVAGSGDYNTYGVPTVHYSTSEQVIGTYLGKPLYQKTYSGLSISCATQGTWYSTGQNYGDIEKIISCELIDQYGQNIRGSAGYMSLTPKPIAINCPVDNRVIIDFTISYTKTTD